MKVPLPLLIEQEEKRREAELDAERPVLRIPVPEFPPEYYESMDEPDAPSRGVVIIDLVGEEE